MIIIEEKDKTYSMAAHLSALSGIVVPLGHILGPLIVWLMKKDESPIIDSQAKEAMNFQITVTLGVAISIPLCFILVGFLLIFALMVADIVFVIIAAVRTYDGHQYRYPLSLRLIT